ncbi:MAG: hypothetical protein HY897_25135 [Deltaproteobacteria bacterium]|nr:hypothetical protein [Deltaproteobacteria bacterium]
MRRFSETAAARLGRGRALAVVCAGVALIAAAAIGGSGAGVLAVLGACAVWAWIARRKAAADSTGEPGLRLMSSISLPGGARIHEVACGSRRVLVGTHGGRLCVIDRTEERGEEDPDE